MRALIKWHRSPNRRMLAGWFIAITLSLGALWGQGPAAAQEGGAAGDQVEALIQGIDRGLSGEEGAASVDALTGSLQELLDRSDAGEVEISDKLKVRARLTIARAGVRRIKRAPAGERAKAAADRGAVEDPRADRGAVKDPRAADRGAAKDPRAADRGAVERGIVEDLDATALLLRGAGGGEEERSEGVRTLQRGAAAREKGARDEAGQGGDRDDGGDEEDGDEEDGDEEVEGIGGAEDYEGDEEDLDDEEAPGPRRVITRMTMGAGELAEDLEGDTGLAAGEEGVLKGQEGFVFGWPVKGVRVTSKYGMRMHPKLKRRKMHKGTDLGGPRGTPVLATGPGKVLCAGEGTGGVGIQVVLEHPGGWVSRYFHMNKVDVEVGDIVKRGERIGEIGSTGRSTGPHLHFQLEYLGHAIDPQIAVGKRADKIRPKM